MGSPLLLHLFVYNIHYYLNCQHPNIKFISEIEENNSISFLDTKVSRVNNSFSTNIYRKVTVEFSLILKALFLYLISRIWYLRYHLELLNYVLILNFFIKKYWILRIFLKEMVILVTLLTLVLKDIWTKFSQIKRYMPLHLKRN